MVTFDKLGENGRLGNQLFQYAALKGLATKNGYEMKIPDPQTRSWHGQACLLDKFNIKSDYLTQEDANTLHHVYEEPSWQKYDPNFFGLPDNTTIDGYYQSIFYFEHIQKEIKKELTPKNEYLDRAIDYIDYLKNQYQCEIVSVHVRRGDNIIGFESGGMYETYFNKAKKIFEGKNIKFLVFTGGQLWNEDNTPDIIWCKDFFKGDDFIFSENQTPIIDFCRIMSCDHNILSQASSFGWWAAYVNPNPNKIVVAPEWYHPDEPTLKREKFYPKEYILK